MSQAGATCHRTYGAARQWAQWLSSISNSCLVLRSLRTGRTVLVQYGKEPERLAAGSDPMNSPCCPTINSPKPPGEQSLSYKSDPEVGISLIDRFTARTLSFLEGVGPGSEATLADLFATYKWVALLPHVYTPCSFATCSPWHTSSRWGSATPAAVVTTARKLCASVPPCVSVTAGLSHDWQAASVLRFFVGNGRALPALAVARLQVRGVGGAVLVPVHQHLPRPQRH